jgi:hypothetical protein
MLHRIFIFGTIWSEVNQIEAVHFLTGQKADIKQRY